MEPVASLSMQTCDGAHTTEGYQTYIDLLTAHMNASTSADEKKFDMMHIEYWQRAIELLKQHPDLDIQDQGNKEQRAAIWDIIGNDPQEQALKEQITQFGLDHKESYKWGIPMGAPSAAENHYS